MRFEISVSKAEEEIRKTFLTSARKVILDHQVDVYLRPVECCIEVKRVALQDGCRCCDGRQSPFAHVVVISQQNTVVSDKSKKFEPSAGFVVSVHMNKLGIRAVAAELDDIFAEELAEAMDKAGFQLVPDPFNLTSDAKKVIELEERQKNAGLKLVKEEANDDASGNTATD